jgi:membrane protease YdiL (CAAX protease family)
VISPLSEEIVFRGVLYNRLRRHFCGSGGLPVSGAVVVSGVMFGIYHGNLVQGIYGCCMGILITWLYERTHDFRIPCLFHGVANCVVYLTAQNAALQEKLFTVPWCVLLLVVAVGLLCLLEKTVRRYSENSTKYH